MITLKRGFYAAIALLILLTGYLLLRRHDKKHDAQIGNVVLGADDREKIIVDPKLHTLITITEKGQTKSYLNPHGKVSITEKKDGSVVINQRTWGTIHEPNLSLALGSDFKPRLGIGCNFIYVHSFELGAGLLISPTQFKDVRVEAHLGYNFYSNLLINVGVDNHKTIQGSLSIRF